MKHCTHLGKSGIILAKTERIVVLHMGYHS